MTSEVEWKPSWVYNMADYCQMFDLQESDLALSLLDFPAGISSFNAEMHEKGYRVKSGDRLYRLLPPEIRKLSQQIFETNERYLESHQDILRGGETMDLILSDWQKSLQLFMDDYEQGQQEERYQFMELPRLPFDHFAFDIGLCSDHLFHSQNNSLENQQQMLEEMCRVAKEVRVFPVLDDQGNIAETLGQVILTSQQKGYGVEVREVTYHQMKGGNAMLRIWATECVVET